jgi:hypothetical protein
MDSTLKAIIRGAAALALVQGPLVADLTAVSVPAKIVSGIISAVALAGLLAEVGLDTLGQAQSTAPPAPKA